MTLWTSAEAVEATGGRATSDWVVNGVSIDTRTLQPGDLFVALKAARDGHDFVAQALENGAGAALVSRVPDGVPEDAPLLIVPDVLAGLEALGRASRARTRARIVAVTGSVGKTSTKEMLHTVLSRQGRTHVAEASYNNHWGVPLTLARMPVDTEFGVFEIGMSNPGEIAPLARMVRPHVAMITAIAPAHLEAFDDISGIAREKASITEGLEPGGIAILNADTTCADRLFEISAENGAECRGFGAAGDAVTLTTLTLSGDTTLVEATSGDDAFLLKINSAGRHFGMNGLGVLAAVQALGGDLGRAVVDMPLWRPPAGRGTRERIILDEVEVEASIDLIDDAFNANPTSMAAAFEVLASAEPVHNIGRVQKGRRVAILGDMLELGADELDKHAALAADTNLAKFDKIHCVGPRMHALYEALAQHMRGHWFETADAAASEAHRLIDAGDVVLIKGSKGSQVARVVDAIRKLGHPPAQ
ncbi:UDP-N-acetylmuramoyl-tripeptide--D-alanyl-D-alanine ligase [Shimia ponticola]|uniref:UDP-N-acetylmuramoyl-tripeptide--D-alanyl-D- alanine ligase n=1 Tax=Shimia ponticola TaxID=2582893 RepID=UPI0011BE2758|nr:UDP-N-acetylmuramoyl-tripeptide--D-alanyl-D-alanine ligase [Shimia ponticola]